MKNPFATSEADPLRLIVPIKLKPGAESRFLEQMAIAVPLNRAEPGNLGFDVLKVQGTSDQFILVEHWKDQASLDWHMAQEYTQAVFAMLAETLNQPLSEAVAGIQFVEELFPAANAV
jgi:quinol monooxygenase YgiN